MNKIKILAIVSLIALSTTACISSRRSEDKFWRQATPTIGEFYKN